MKSGHPGGIAGSPLLAYAVGSLAAVALPLLLRAIPSLVGHAVAGAPLLSTFAPLQTLVVGATLYLTWRRSACRESLLPDLACTLAVSVFFLGIVADYAARTWDWWAYEGAARAVAQGGNLYTEADYLYTPVPAQVVAVVMRLARLIVVSPSDVSDLLFYLWQCLQFQAVLACYVMSRVLLRRAGLSSWHWTLALAGLFVLNVPMLRALRFNQPAMYLLMAALLVAVWSDRHPCLAGLSVAGAVFVKVFPVVLLLPALISRKWRLLGWAVGWLAAIGVASVVMPEGRAYWLSFVDLLRGFPEPLAFRDNSLPSLVRNTARVLALGPFPLWVARAVQVLWGAWLLWRIARRTVDRPGDHATTWLGNISDTLCLGLVLSPTVWENYFIFLIPGMIWSWRAAFPRHPRTVAAAAVLVFLVPVFDVFLLSYLRLVGMFLLARATPVTAAGLGEGSGGVPHS